MPLSATRTTLFRTDLQRPGRRTSPPLNVGTCVVSRSLIETVEADAKQLPRRRP